MALVEITERRELLFTGVAESAHRLRGIEEAAAAQDHFRELTERGLARPLQLARRTARAIGNAPRPASCCHGARYARTGPLPRRRTTADRREAGTATTTDSIATTIALSSAPAATSRTRLLRPARPMLAKRRRMVGYRRSRGNRTGLRQPMGLSAIPTTWKRATNANRQWHAVRAHRGAWPKLSHDRAPNLAAQSPLQEDTDERRLRHELSSIKLEAFGEVRPSKT